MENDVYGCLSLSSSKTAIYRSIVPSSGLARAVENPVFADGKEGVVGSIPTEGSRRNPCFGGGFLVPIGPSVNRAPGLGVSNSAIWRYKHQYMADQTPEKHPPDVFERALALVGVMLAERGLAFEVVVIGGANLALTGLIPRPTVDVDVVAIRTSRTEPLECARPLPTELREAVSQVAELIGLYDGWMNGAASSDFDLGLPPGFEQRLSVRTFGGLRVAFAHRRDIVAWKLQAAVDQLGTRNRHMDDLRRLRPAEDELIAARRWFETVEGPDSAFWSHLDSLLTDIEVAPHD
jgi:hypothetical protein